MLLLANSCKQDGRDEGGGLQVFLLPVPSYLFVGLEVGKEVSAAVTEGLKVVGAIVGVGAVVGVVLVAGAGAFALARGAGGPVRGGLGGLGEVASVGYLAFLAVVAGPLAIALEQRVRYVFFSLFKSKNPVCWVLQAERRKRERKWQLPSVVVASRHATGAGQQANGGSWMTAGEAGLAVC